MKTFLITLIAFVIAISVYSQNQFVYNEYGEKVYFQNSDSIIQIRFNENVEVSKKLELAKLVNTAEASHYVSDRNRIHIPIDKTKRIDIKELNARKNIIYANKSLLSYDGTLQIPTNKVLVRIKNGYKLEYVLQKLDFQYKSFNRLGHNENAFLLILKNGESIAAANFLYESGYFVYAQPSFTRLAEPMNAFYPDQWGLNNTGQNGGTPGIDIDAPEAWNITTGCDNIIIAVIDQGVDLDHPDLDDNLIVGYDATDGGPGGDNGDCWGNDAHGTCCAGIIAAEDNTIGIKGVAPNCLIDPIRVSYKVNNISQWDDDWTVDAINHAWEIDGADILSCSWSGGEPSPAVNDEINDALTFGRTNLGCVVVFSVGNYNLSSVNWPANSNLDIIAVGAMSPCGERKDPNSCDDEDWYRAYPYNDYLGGSNYGSQLDVVAPGVFIPTTDIQGSLGFNNSQGTYGDYYLQFNGTSAAAPHVSGIAALLLSVNPNLTQDQVRDAIESSCDKVGGYSYTTTSGRNNGIWNNEMGYGKVNAYKALQEVLPSISGSATVCNSNTTFTLNNRPAGTTVNWTHSSNLVYVSGQGTDNLTVRKFKTSGEGWVKATVTSNNCGTYDINKTVWVGNPPKTEDINVLSPGWDKNRKVACANMVMEAQAENYTQYSNSNSFDTEWWISGGTILDEDDVSLSCFFRTTSTLNRTVTLKARFENQCGMGSYQTIEAITIDCQGGGGALLDTLYMFIYPNPAKDFIDVIIKTEGNNISETSDIEFEVRLFNKDQVLLYSNKTNNRKIRIDTRNFPEGNYFLHVIYGDKIIKRQVLIE